MKIIVVIADDSFEVRLPATGKATLAQTEIEAPLLERENRDAAMERILLPAFAQASQAYRDL